MADVEVDAGYDDGGRSGNAAVTQASEMEVFRRANPASGIAHREKTTQRDTDRDTEREREIGDRSDRNDRDDWRIVIGEKTILSPSVLAKKK